MSAKRQIKDLALENFISHCSRPQTDTAVQECPNLTILCKLVILGDRVEALQCTLLTT